MKCFVHKGVHYMEPISEPILKTPFKWDGVDYPVDSIFDRLGSNSRQSLNVGWNLIYKGKCGPFVLFTHDAATSPKQLNIFNEQQRRAYIALGYLDDQNLIMPTGISTHYDIVP